MQQKLERLARAQWILWQASGKKFGRGSIRKEGMEFRL
jgi:hypothetical protein